MAFTEQDRAAAEQALRRLSEHNDELLMRGLDRLGQLGSALTTAPPDKFWPTTAALMGWHGQQRRAIAAGLGALNRLTRRPGGNGVNRYPMSEWGEPLALVGWMRPVRGRPAPLGMAPGERGALGEAGEACPNCTGGPMEMTTRANGIGGRQVRKTFGRCRSCQLVIDATETWAPEEREVQTGDTTQAVAAPHVSYGGTAVTGSPPRRVAERRERYVPVGERPARSPAAPAAGLRNGGRPYVDEYTNDWRRDVGKGVPMLVAGPDDMSEQQKRREGECWACAMAPHSRAYHDMKIAEALATYRVRRVEEDGRVRVHVPESEERFHDESAQ